MLATGVYPASITAFDDKGMVDHLAMARLLSHFEAQGCKGVVLAGTNGEGPSLSAVEKRDLVRAMVPVKGKLDVIAGVASNSLEEAVWLVKQATKDGAAAALVMAPSYFREAREDGVASWFEELMSRTNLPILVYNFPQRTGFTHTAEFMARLSTHPNFAGLKDSSGNEDNLDRYRSVLSAEHVLFVGNETLLLRALDLSWTGTISGAANVVASWLVEVIRSEGENQEVKFDMLMPVLESIRKAPQPATHKAVLQALGYLDQAAVRLPLEASRPEETAHLLASLSSLGLESR